MIKKIENLKFLIILLLAIVIFTCDDENWEEEYFFFQENLDVLIDSTLIDRRKLVVPSPSDFKDSTSQNQLRERVLAKNKVELPALTIVLKDSIAIIRDLEVFEEKIRAYFSGTNNSFSIANTNKKNSYEADISDFTINESKYELISYTELEKRKTDINYPEKDLSTPIFSLSRIYFNSKHDIGAFKVSIVHGNLDAYGVIVIIRNNNNIWIIEDIIKDWES